MLNAKKSLLRKQYVFFVLFVVALFGFALFVLLSSGITKAVQQVSKDSDFEVKVTEILELRLATCNSDNPLLVAVDIIPSSAGTFKSNCQETFVNTNAPGYTLSAKATGSHPNYQSGNDTNAMLYQNSTTVTPFPVIVSTANTIDSPQELSNDTWGFAVEGLNSTGTPSNEVSSPSLIPSFDTTYTINDSNNKYANLPTSDTTIYKTTNFPLPETTHKFYYAARLTPETMAGVYATTITYTAIGEVVLE